MSIPNQILRNLQIWDAGNGIGKGRSVWLVRRDGLSIMLELACLFLINARQAIMMAFAQLAIRDMISKTGNVCLLCPIMLSLPTLAVELGTGTTKSAFHAQTVGSSTLIKSAFLFPTNAKPTLKMETALLAMKATTSRTANVPSRTPTRLAPLILVAQHGTGKTKFA